MFDDDIAPLLSAHEKMAIRALSNRLRSVSPHLWCRILNLYAQSLHKAAQDLTWFLDFPESRPHAASARRLAKSAEADLARFYKEVEEARSRAARAAPLFSLARRS